MKLKKIYWLIERNSLVYIVTYGNQLEVASLKIFFFLAVLKLTMKESFGYTKEIERMGNYKYYLAGTFEWTWKWKSQHCCCFTWIVFIKLNFTVGKGKLEMADLLVRSREGEGRAEWGI